MHSREELSEIIEEYITGLSFPEKPDDLYDPIKYSLESGGKRIRPLLTMMACNIFSDDVRPALPCAGAVEVFHNFTLLHDDIMDNATIRRGRPAVRRKWSDNIAILSGDAMMIYAYILLAHCPPGNLPAILDIFSKVSLKVCEGQQYDMDFETLENVSIDRYLEMISLKTAALMAGATLLGAISGGADKKDHSHIYTFGMELGMAFQIQDDILDSYGSADKLGKSIGGDIMEGKKTYLTITAMQGADSEMRTHLAGILHNKDLIAEQKIARVLDIYDKLDVCTHAEKAVGEHTARAIAALDSLSVDKSRTEPIRELALELTKRIC